MGQDGNAMEYDEEKVTVLSNRSLTKDLYSSSLLPRHCRKRKDQQSLYFRGLHRCSYKVKLLLSASIDYQTRKRRAITMRQRRKDNDEYSRPKINAYYHGRRRLWTIRRTFTKNCAVSIHWTVDVDLRPKRKHIVLPSWVEECLEEETLMNEDGRSTIRPKLICRTQTKMKSCIFASKCRDSYNLHPYPVLSMTTRSYHKLTTCGCELHEARCCRFALTRPEIDLTLLLTSPLAVQFEQKHCGKW